MKKSSLFVALLLANFTLAQAQWISPGNGTTYSTRDLVEASDGCVEFTGDGTFRINSDLTISENDNFVITEGENNILVKDQVTITIKGSFNCPHHNNYVEMKTENDEHYNLRFENATDCALSGIKFKFGGGFMIIESNVTFDDCYFVHSNTQSNNAAVNYMNCSPVFKGCTFKNNDGAAIASGVNVNGSPTIMDCFFYNNVITNQNLPQINLGPGAEDTIRIVNNIIEGNHYSMSGGIAITDLMGTGSTKVLLKGNEIKNNRYGYNQQGMVISSLIIDNVFSDNNAEVDPMNGGSGISIYGYSTDMKAKLRHNTITGNEWGITAIYYNDIDMGTEDDWGYNIISGNHNSAYGEDAVFAIYNNSFSDISAIGNYWGTNDETEVEDVIYHYPDLGEGYGTVSYLPFLPSDPTGIGQHDESNGQINVFPNPSQGQFTIINPAENNQIQIFDMMGQLVYAGQIEKGESQIDLSNLDSGMYFALVGFGRNIQKATILITK